MLAAMEFLKRFVFQPDRISILTASDDIPEDIFKKIEIRAELTQARGDMPLWSGYSRVYSSKSDTFKRSSDQVRINSQVGRTFAKIAHLSRPKVVVEIGSAFGVSGMYWLSGLELNNHGTLHTFEPNAVWQPIAKENLTHIGSRFLSYLGTFEETIGATSIQRKSVGIAFIDAIHATVFVKRQIEILLPLMAPLALILLDDINFSEDMKKCWKLLRRSPQFSGYSTISNRVGVLQMRA